MNKTLVITSSTLTAIQIAQKVAEYVWDRNALKVNWVRAWFPEGHVDDENVKQKEIYILFGVTGPTRAGKFEVCLTIEQDQKDGTFEWRPKQGKSIDVVLPALLETSFPGRQVIPIYVIMPEVSARARELLVEIKVTR